MIIDKYELFFNKDIRKKEFIRPILEKIYEKPPLGKNIGFNCIRCCIKLCI